MIVSDYVPGFNPADTTSTVHASLVPDSAVCTGSLVCEVSVGDDGLVTWEAGTVHDAAGTVEMIVTIPQVPDAPEFDENGVYSATLWNDGYLRWHEVTGGTPGGAAAGRLAGSALDFTFTQHELESNEVEVSASLRQDPVIDPPVDPEDPTDPKLPNTGAPAFLAGLTILGGLVLALGGGLVHRGRRNAAVPQG